MLQSRSIMRAGAVHDARGVIVRSFTLLHVNLPTLLLFPARSQLASFLLPHVPARGGSPVRRRVMSFGFCFLFRWWLMT